MNSREVNILDKRLKSLQKERSELYGLPKPLRNIGKIADINSRINKIKGWLE